MSTSRGYALYGDTALTTAKYDPVYDRVEITREHYDMLVVRYGVMQRESDDIKRNFNALRISHDTLSSVVHELRTKLAAADAECAILKRELYDIRNGSKRP